MLKGSSMKRTTLRTILISTLLSSFLLSSAMAQTTTVKVDPSFVEVGTGTFPTDPFNITITVHNITLLVGWQVNMTFNSTVLNVLDVSRPSDDVFAGKAVFEVVKDINNTAGYVFFTVALGIGENAVNVTDGKLCVVQLEGISEGSCNLTLVQDTPDIWGVKLTGIDENGEVYEIYPSLQDGQVIVIPEFLAIAIVPILMVLSLIAFLMRKKYLTSKTLH